MVRLTAQHPAFQAVAARIVSTVKANAERSRPLALKRVMNDPFLRNSGDLTARVEEQHQAILKTELKREFRRNGLLGKYVGH